MNKLLSKRKLSTIKLLLLSAFAISCRTSSQHSITKITKSPTSFRWDESQPSNVYIPKIHDTYNHELFFPERWRLPPYSCKGTQITSFARSRIQPYIHRFLRSYKPAFLRQNLQSIYLMGTLHCQGYGRGGTYLYRSIYATYNNTSLRYFLGLLHAEFSSILFHRYAFPKERWNNINPSNWTYLGKKYKLPPGSPHKASLLRLRMGLLTHYSQKSMEEDINTYAHWHFVKRRNLKRLATTYRRIKLKYALLKNFYKEIDALQHRK